MQLQKRKPVRLKGFDYNTSGAYFITICTKNRKEMLSNINVGTGVLDGPKAVLSKYGEIADRQIKTMSAFYDNILVDKYCIMPNHIHLLIRIFKDSNGPSGMPVPTDINIKIDNKNSAIAKFVGTFKRFCNKEYGKNIWQDRSYDHIIRDEKDYLKILQYIQTNPQKWQEDCFYAE